MDCFNMKWLLLLIFSGIVLANSNNGEDEDDNSWLLPNATIADQIVEINKEDGAKGLINGDIMPSSHEAENGNGKRNALRNRGQIWRTRIIPYVFDSSLSNNKKQVIRAAINEFEQKSCIRFKSVTRSTKEHYIRFFNGVGCYSTVGRFTYNRKYQDISIGYNCGHKGVVMHEIMHALGFNHEQNRYDRDKYIKINWDNIIDDKVDNFDITTIQTVTSLGLPYDYDGIMHYGPTIFAKNPRYPTMVKLKKTGGPIGSKKGFSDTDLKQLNLLYDCKTSSLTNSWSSWSAYSKCFAYNDRQGKREHSQRFCFKEDLKLCPGADWYFGTQKRSRPCRSAPTTGSGKAVNGGWSNYGPFGLCSKTCGGGYRYKHRTCTNPAPANGGRNCVGTGKNRMNCNTQSCQGKAVNGGWSNYGPFKACSKSCGGGWTFRHRTCNNPSPAHGGRLCAGFSIGIARCNTHSCQGGRKIDGGWSSWSAKKPCSKSCGGGMQWRSRTCTNPRPKNGGKECPGFSSSGSPCNAFPCQARGSCEIKYTNWYWSYQGSMKSLDHHKMDCGSGKVLSMFHLEFNRIQIRYKYQCCSTGTTSYCKNQQRYTGWVDAVDDKTTHLSKVISYCGSKGFVNGIHLERNPKKNQFRYHYQCCIAHQSHNQATCKTTHTSFTDNGRGKAFYLDRQTVQCSKGRALSFFILNLGHNTWRYIYRCCKFGA